MDAALSPPLMPLCLFVAAISHSVPSVCCFVAVCIWLCLCVSSSTSFFHQFLPPVSHFFWLIDHSMLSASHLPMTKYLFCVPVFSQPSCFFVSQFLPVCLGFSQSHSVSLSLSLSHLPAFRKEFQSQLFILELLQAHHDGILVYAGLSSAGHQSYTHQLLLHPPYQLCSAHGPRGGQGRHFSLLVHARRGWAISRGQLFIIWLAVVGQHILKIEGEEEKKRERPQHLKSKLWIFGVWITTLAGKIFTIDLSSCMMTLIWGGKCTSNISEFWITKADTKISFRSYFHSKSDAWLIRQWKHVFVFRFWFCFGFFRYPWALVGG